jgi:hypothetical protein
MSEHAAYNLNRDIMRKGDGSGECVTRHAALSRRYVKREIIF